MKNYKSKIMRSFITDALICILLGLCMLLMTSSFTYGQNVGINNSTPHAKALLDLTSTDKGMLAPRLTQVQRIAMFPAPDLTAKGMLVYQTDNAQGFYYYDGTSWNFLGANGTDWSLTGNSGTSANTNFIGTTDNNDLSVKTNSIEAIRIKDNQHVGIGTATPLQKLDVRGSINILVDSSYRINNIAVVSTRGGTNTFLGPYSGISNNTGVWNSFTGNYAGANNTGGFDNSFYGGNSGFFNTTGSGNAFYGNGSGFKNTTGSQNTFIGKEAALNITTGSNNTAVGTYAGVDLNTGSQNTYLGYNARGYATLTNSAAIGANAFTGVNNGLVIGDTSVLVGIGNSFPAYPMSFQNKTGDKISLFGGAGAHYGFGIQPYLMQIHSATSVDDIAFGYGSSNTFSEKMRIKGNGKVGIGTKTPGTLYSFTAVEIADSTGQSKDLMLRSSSASSHSSLLLTRTRGTLTVPAIVQNSEDLGRVSGCAFDGAKLMTAAEIQFHTDSIPALDKMPGNITFHTTSSTSGGFPIERLRINRNGFIGIGTANPVQILDITGNINVMNDSNYRIGNVRVLAATGAGNTFVGKYSGLSNTGTDNSFIGYYAGYNNVSGNKNSFAGSYAGYTNSTGVNNTFLGYKSGYVTNANNNTFVGWQSGLANTGQSNSFYGSNTGYQNTTGEYNSFFGSYAGGSSSTGTHNVSVGYFSLGLNSSGGSNVAVGNFAGYKNGTANYTTCLGASAGYNNTVSYGVFVGTNAGYSNTTGAMNTVVGLNAAYNNSTGSNNTFLGYYAGYNSNANNNTFVGWQCGGQNTIGTSNSFFGSNAGVANQTGYNNSFFGGNAGNGNTNGVNNVAMGNFALGQNAGGSNNVAVGTNAGFTGNAGINNSFLGYNADVTVNNLVNATAIGANAKITVSNAIALGQAGTMVGIGFAVPGFPLNFENVTGDKISLYGNSGSHYGLGVQASLLQMHSATSADDIAFGFGSSASFTENVRIKGNGNVGIGTTAPTTKLEVNGFTKLGSNAPGVKMIKLTGTSPATQGGSILINHGLVINKILSVQVFVEKSATVLVPPSNDSVGDEYSFQVTSTAISITNKSANSINLISKPVRILVTYEE
jgi:hypothetical protein